MSHDTWIHRIVRIAVHPLAKTAVTPNHLTTLRLILGIGAAFLFAVGNSPAQYYGAGLFVVSMMIDRADGELARATGKSSPWGHSYDLISDAVCNALAFVGIGIGLRDSGAWGSWSVLLGVVAGLSVACVLWLVIKVEAVEGARAAEFGGTGGFDPDDAMLAVPVAVIFGWNHALLLAAAIGAPAFALFAWLRFRQKASKEPR